MFDFTKDADKKSSTGKKSSLGFGEPSKGKMISSGGAAVIGPTVTIEGKVVSGEDLIVEGSVSGSISAKGHEITVGTAGKLKADISAKVVRVEGSVQGDISGVEKVIISKTGNVLGNIDAPRVTLEDGAKFKGSIEMDPGETATSELPAKAAIKDNAPLFSADKSKAS
ncbi:MAG: polymer-forming cytoskeletal protein [Porticoccaceae bacterium]|jgi:cytoskeletal protein CcmA (bactofilin family)|nr:polymer-forming cytoskeletal protein [Porticoccaceae bacterium]